MVVSAVAATADRAVAVTANADAISKPSIRISFESNGRCQPFGSIFLYHSGPCEVEMKQIPHFPIDSLN